MRVCPTAGCPEITPGGPCDACRAKREHARGTRQARGYDRAHDQLRAKLKPGVDTGLVDCTAPTCIERLRRILPGQAWDLGHDDQRRHRGPEHASCNRSAGGKAAHPQ